jgi:hypothetical protein
VDICSACIFSCISSGVSMFDMLLLFQCYPEVGRGAVLALHSVISIPWRWFFTLLAGG